MKKVFIRIETACNKAGIGIVFMETPGETSTPDLCWGKGMVRNSWKERKSIFNYRNS